MKHGTTIIMATGLFACNVALADGIYFGAGLTITQIEEPGFDDGFRVDDEPAGWRLLAGYAFSQYFAIEGTYLHAGDADGAQLRAGPTNGFEIPSTTELTGYSVSLVGVLPIGSSTEVFAKLGYFDGERDIQVSDVSTRVKQGENNVSLGGGVGFKLADNFTIRGDLDWYDTNLDTLWSIGVGLQYDFGH